MGVGGWGLGEGWGGKVWERTVETVLLVALTVQEGTGDPASACRCWDQAGASAAPASDTPADLFPPLAMCGGGGGLRGWRARHSCWPAVFPCREATAGPQRRALPGVTAPCLPRPSTDGRALSQPPHGGGPPVPTCHRHAAGSHVPSSFVIHSPPPSLPCSSSLPFTSPSVPASPLGCGAVCLLIPTGRPLPARSAPCSSPSSCDVACRRPPHRQGEVDAVPGLAGGTPCPLRVSPPQLLRLVVLSTFFFFLLVVPRVRPAAVCGRVGRWAAGVGTEERMGGVPHTRVHSGGLWGAAGGLAIPGGLAGGFRR